MHFKTINVSFIESLLTQKDCFCRWQSATSWFCITSRQLKLAYIFLKNLLSHNVVILRITWHEPFLTNINLRSASWPDVISVPLRKYWRRKSFALASLIFSLKTHINQFQFLHYVCITYVTLLVRLHILPYIRKITFITLHLLLYLFTH